MGLIDKEKLKHDLDFKSFNEEYNMSGGLWVSYRLVEEVIDAQPAQPEIIRCNACRYWHQTTGDMEGFGLGNCDYLEKKLVTCNGYCYWAERRTDE